MNAFTKALAAGLGQMAQTVRQMRHPGQPMMFERLLRRTRFDYRQEVGDGLDASVLTAPIMWVQRALPEATLAIRETSADGSIEDIEEHELLALIQTPNPFYGDIALWGATVLSFLIDGNAYWVKVRNAAGKPIQLWWVPWWMIEPKAPLDGSDFIEYYEYLPGTGAGRMILDPEDVVHFRNGINPRNLMKGLSPIQGVIREIFTDLESSNFIASLLRNMGMPGVIISPKGGAMPSPDDVEATKSWFNQAFGGDNRGKPMVMGAPTEVESFGFNPDQMNLSHGSNRAEERVCACIGIPAAIVGFGAGLEQTKVGATMEAMAKQAWQNGVLPLGRQLVDELQRSLLPDFQRSAQQRGRRFTIYWNTDDVTALQEDEDKQTDRKLKEFAAGAITLFEYRSETGRDADDRHRYYHLPINILQVPEAEAGLAVRNVSASAGLLPAPEVEPAKSLPAPQTKSAHTCAKCSAGVDGEDGLKDGMCAKCVLEAQPTVSITGAKHAGDDQGHDHGPPAGARVATQEAMVRGERFVMRLQRAEKGLSAAFEAAIRPTFEGWGDQAGRVAEQVLRANGEKSDGKVIETKAADASLIQQIIDLLNLESWERQLSAKYQAQFLGIARDVAEAVEASGFGTMLPDPIAREIIATGGRRVGLIDLDGQTRQALFDALTEGREAGEGATALANRIANHVEGGHWGNAETRARVIARTETKFAQNISTIENGVSNGFTEFVIFDGRLGPGRSKPDHIARNGLIVNAADARIMAEEEHPNGTLSFSPNMEI